MAPFPSRIPLRSYVVGAAALAFLAASPAAAGETLSGPVAATALRAIDGDTITVVARIWLGQSLVTDVRIRGIDAPERRGACDGEREMAARATARLAAAAAGELRLAAIGEDKYSGRIVADVTTADGTDLGALMLASGLARPYDGGRRSGWCDGAAR